MTPDEYRLAIAELGLTQVAAATMLGVDYRTSKNWSSGSTRIPHAVEMLLRIMVHYARASSGLPMAQ